MRKLLFILVALAFIAGAVSAQEIAVIVKTGNSSFWQNVQTGCFDAQKELKAQSPKLSVTFLGPQSESNVTEEINIVESAIDRGVKAIVLAPSDVTALVPAVKKAKDCRHPGRHHRLPAYRRPVQLRFLPRHRQRRGGKGVRKRADRPGQGGHGQ